MFGLSAWDYALLNQLQRIQEVDDLFNGNGRRDIRSLPRGTFPAVNIGNSPQQVDVYLFAPGLDSKAFDIQIQNNLLTVAGRRDLASHADKDEYTWYRRERISGEFRRMISLPDDVDPERIEARYRDGVLHIVVQRRESAQPRRIEIH